MRLLRLLYGDFEDATLLLGSAMVFSPLAVLIASRRSPSNGYAHLICKWGHETPGRDLASIPESRAVGLYVAPLLIKLM